MTPGAWEALGELRKNLGRPTRIHGTIVLLLLRLGLAEEVKRGSCVCTMTEYGQWVWVNHGPIDDRRYL